MFVSISIKVNELRKKTKITRYMLYETPFSRRILLPDIATNYTTYQYHCFTGTGTGTDFTAEEVNIFNYIILYYVNTQIRTLNHQFCGIGTKALRFHVFRMEWNWIGMKWNGIMEKTVNSVFVKFYSQNSRKCFNCSNCLKMSKRSILHVCKNVLFALFPRLFLSSARANILFLLISSKPSTFASVRVTNVILSVLPHFEPFILISWDFVLRFMFEMLKMLEMFNCVAVNMTCDHYFLWFLSVTLQFSIFFFYFPKAVHYGMFLLSWCVCVCAKCVWLMNNSFLLRRGKKRENISRWARKCC